MNMTSFHLLVVVWFESTLFVHSRIVFLSIYIDLYNRPLNSRVCGFFFGNYVWIMNDNIKLDTYDVHVKQVHLLIKSFKSF